MRRTVWCRVTTLLLTIVLLTSLSFSMSACGKEDDAVLIARAKELIPKTEVINKLFYIEGIPTLEGADSVSGYYPADMVELFLLGFESVADIKDYMRTIWAPEFCEVVFASYLFASVYNGDMIVDFAYCYDCYEKGYDGEEVYAGIRVYQDGLSITTSPTEYHYDTLKVEKKTKERAELSISVTVYGEDGTTQDKTLTVVLSKTEEGIWMLDSYTGVKYFTPPKTN